MMNQRHRAALGLLVVAAALAGAPLAAGQAPPVTPTKDAPLRFAAFGVSMQAGISGTTLITIERFSTPEERKMLLGVAAEAKEGREGQRTLLSALQKVKPRCGFIRLPNTLGWDLRYAWERVLADGTRQIVIATDKPVSFAAAANSARTLDYPFTLLEMRMKPGEKGEGRMLAQTSISTNNGQLELENYGQAPVQLTSITDETKAPKDKKD